MSSCVILRIHLSYPHSLVDSLGLKSTLTEYNVPRDDIPKVAELAVGKKDDIIFPKVVKLLESLY